MPRMPAAATSANRSHRRARVSRLARRVCLVASSTAGFVATTGAAVGPGASRAELIMYSLGSTLALIMAIRIIIRLFVYIVQAAAVLAFLTMVFVLFRITIEAMSS